LADNDIEVEQAILFGSYAQGVDETPQYTEHIDKLHDLMAMFFIDNDTAFRYCLY